ncbi:hypothetical protein EI94DRAFT_1804762 [Lactarius quietus]|nr:hypothetical protein EI94DRAFT_1804762 [Lactarius quietus]
MGPAQPGSQSTWQRPFPPELETFPTPPQKEVHAVDVQALKRLSEDDKACINARLDTLRMSTNKILASVTNFYNHVDLMPTGDWSNSKHGQDEEALNSAFKIMPVTLDGVADNPFTLTDARFELEPNVPRPRTDGELIQHLAEQIAGLVNDTNDRTKEAGALTFFNSVKETARKGLEEGAELQARIKVDEWRSQLVLQLKSASFGEIAESLLSKLKTNPFQAERHLAIAKEILPVLKSLKEIAITKAKEHTCKSDEAEI